jgi:hypothetical protein
VIKIIQLQIISKILQTQSNEIVEDNLLTEDYFVGYEQEFSYIIKSMEIFLIKQVSYLRSLVWNWWKLLKATDI